MTSKKTTTAGGTTARPTCGYPGCDQLAAPAEKPGRPPEYCAGRGHTRASAWKERQRLNAEKNGTTISTADDASSPPTSPATATSPRRHPHAAGPDQSRTSPAPTPRWSRIKGEGVQ